MIIGENSKPGDLVDSTTMKARNLTNHSVPAEAMLRTDIAPKHLMTLEECMEYIQQDECIEVTPNFVRIER